jgi:hypothetical protein
VITGIEFEVFTDILFSFCCLIHEIGKGSHDKYMFLNRYSQIIDVD